MTEEDPSISPKGKTSSLAEIIGALKPDFEEGEDINFIELLSLARNKSQESRQRLMHTISDLFIRKNNVLTDQERNLMVDIIHHLIRDVEISVRTGLAEKLQKNQTAPKELVVMLANDHIEVAHPLLQYSSVLQDIELVEVIRHRTMQHQLAIAMREEVSDVVSDALIEAGNQDVILTLLQNDNASLSKAAMEYLVDRAQIVDSFQNPVLRRPELSKSLAKKLYWSVSAALRQHIVENFEIDPIELDDYLETAVQNLVATLDEGDKAENSSEALARQLKQNGALTTDLLIQVLRQGEVLLFEALFAELTELRLTLARRLVYEPGGEGLAIACKGVLIEKPVFASLFLLSRKARPGDHMVDPMELSKVLAFFDKLTPITATRLLKRWHLDPDYLEAMWQLENGLQKAVQEEEAHGRGVNQS